MDVVELKQKTIKELRDLAIEAGLSGISRLKKDELVARLTQARGSVATAAGDAPRRVAAPRGEKATAATKTASGATGAAKAASGKAASGQAVAAKAASARPSAAPVVEAPAGPSEGAASVDGPPERAPASAVAAALASVTRAAKRVAAPPQAAAVATNPIAEPEGVASASLAPAASSTATTPFAPAAAAVPIDGAPAPALALEPAVGSVHTPASPVQLAADDLPEGYPGTRLRAMVRDPGTVYVYWEQPAAGSPGWEVAALDPAGAVLDAFRTDGAGTSGYLKVPHGAVGQVQLRRVEPDGGVAHVASTWLAAPRSTRSQDRTQRWVEVPSDDPRGSRVVAARPFDDAGLAILDVGQGDVDDVRTPEGPVEVDLPSSRLPSSHSVR